MTVEKINSIEKKTVPVGFEHLFGLEPHIDAMQKKSIDYILVDVCVKAEGIHNGRRWAVIEARILSQNAQAGASEGKHDTYLIRTGVIYNTGNVFFSVFSATAGPATGFGTLLSAVGHLFSTTGDYLSKSNEALIVRYDHTNQRLSLIINELSESIRTADQASNRDHDMIAQKLQTDQRLAESIGSNA